MPELPESLFLLGLLGIFITALVALRKFRHTRERQDRQSERFGTTLRTRIHDPRYTPSGPVKVPSVPPTVP